MRCLFVLTAAALLLATPVALATDGADVSWAPRVAPDGPTSPQQVTPLGGSRLEFVEESFEGLFVPPGWAIITTGEGGTWFQNSAYARTGAYSASVVYSSPGEVQDEWLVTPAMDTTAATSLQLEWWETSRYWGGNFGHHHYIMVSTTSQTDPEAFEVVLDMTPDSHPIPVRPEFGQTTIDLSEYIGEETLYIAFRYTDGGGSEDIWWIDDVWIRQAQDYDIKAVSVTPLDSYFEDGQSVTPQAVFRNIGSYLESFDVSMTISESGAPVFEETRSITDLAPGETTTVVFNDYVVNAGNYIEFIGAAHLSSDQDTANDALSGYNYAYTGQRVPLGLLVTNWGCWPCVQANEALDEYLPEQENDVAVMRVHCWWPSGTDPMYHANVEQNTALIEGTPTGSDYAPHLWLNGNQDGGSNGPSYAGYFEASKLVGAAATLDLAYDADQSRVQVVVTVNENLVPEGIYALRVAITEDAVYEPGPNQEEYHNQVFRYMYPDMEGLTVDTALGEQEFWIDTPLDEGWAFDNLRATAYVQELNTRRVVNAATIMLAGGEVAVGDAPPLRLTQLAGAHPNPFNPLTTISYTVGRSETSRLGVYDLQGRKVAELAGGLHQPGDYTVQWTGTDAAGRSVPSGVYFVRLVAESGAHTQKVMLMK